MIQDFSGILEKLWGAGHWTRRGCRRNAALGLGMGETRIFPMYQDKFSPHILEILLFRG